MIKTFDLIGHLGVGYDGCNVVQKTTWIKYDPCFVNEGKIPMMAFMQQELSTN